MAFKVYNNRKTRHPSISIKSGDKTKWHNLELTHSPSKKQRYIPITNNNTKDPHQSYVRKYYRKDKHKLKGSMYKNFKLSKESENKIKNYLKQHNKNKKR